jgi:O-antigen/teichoic acid export membrane protein
VLKQLKTINTTKTFDFFIYGFGQALNLVSPFLVAPYIISTCGVANFGKSGVAMAIAFFVIVLIDYGSDIVGVKEIAVNRENRLQLKKIFATTFAAKLFLLLVLLTFLSCCYVFIPFFNNEKALYFLTFPILIGQFLNPTWFLQGTDNFRGITSLNLFSKIFYLITIFLIIKKPEDYIYINFLWGFGMIIPFAVGTMICINRYDIKMADFEVKATQLFLKNHFSFFVSQLFLSLKNYAPLVVVSFLGGYFIAGQYSIIEKIVMPFRSYLQIIFRFFYPKLCFELSISQQKGIALWKKINAFNLLLVLILLALVYVFSAQILLFFKVTMVTLEEMQSLLKYSLLIPLLLTISFIFEQLLLSSGNKQAYIKVTILTVVINSLLLPVLFWRFELLGLIFAIVITEIIVIALYILILKKLFKKDAYTI